MFEYDADAMREVETLDEAEKYEMKYEEITRYCLWWGGK